jgi:hypothetical protein
LKNEKDMKKILIIAVAILALMGCNRTCKPDEVRTKEYTYEEYYALAQGRVDSLYVSIALDFPVAMADKEVLSTIQRSIKNELFGDAYQNMDIQQAIEAYTAMLKTEYKQNNLPLIAEGAHEELLDAIFSEQHIITSMIMDIHNSILSYAVERYVFTGGAHGSNYRVFYNFDLSNGRMLHEQDIFAPGFEEPLTELLLTNMVNQNEEVQLIEDLKEYGYNVDEIHPNDNFFLTDSSMVYVFGQYEIAPYALGETEISISYDQLRPLLQEASGL